MSGSCVASLYSASASVMSDRDSRYCSRYFFRPSSVASSSLIFFSTLASGMYLQALPVMVDGLLDMRLHVHLDVLAPLAGAGLHGGELRQVACSPRCGPHRDTCDRPRSARCRPSSSPHGPRSAARHVFSCSLLGCRAMASSAVFSVFCSTSTVMYSLSSAALRTQGISSLRRLFFVKAWLRSSTASLYSGSVPL